MKNLILTGIILFLSLTVLAQTPAMFSYQAVIRNSESELMVNEEVSITVEIVKSSFDGDVVFAEEHQTSTNAYGLVSLKIGSINPLDAIDWGADVYFVRISVDDIEMGTSQLLSVPYAMHAKTVDNMFSGNYSDLSGTPDLSEFITEISEQSIGDLSDVDLNGLVDNQILKYNAGLGKWIAIDVAAASETDPEFNASPASAITNAGSGMVITNDERSKLTGIETGAEVNVNADWNASEGDAQILNKPAFSNVALSGNYNDLLNAPELFDGTWVSLTGKPNLSTVATSGNYNDLSNTPDLFDGTWGSLTGKPNLSTVATTGNYTDLNGLPTLFDGTWASLAGKPNLSTVATTGNYTDLNGLPTLFDGTWASLAGKPSLSTVATTGDYNNLSNRPITITPAQSSAIDANTLKRSYPIVDETKLAGIQAGAEVNVNPDWNAVSGDAQIINKPVLSSLAISGNFNDITNKPTTLAGYGIVDAISTSHAAYSIGFSNISNWNAAYSWGNHAGLYRSSTWVPAWADVTGKPSFATVAISGNYNDLANLPALSTVASTGLYSDILGLPTLSTVATTGNYADLANLPTYSTVASTGNYSDLSGAPNLTVYATKDMNSENITNLANPVNNQDAATKSYADMKFQMLLNYMVETGANIQGLLDAGISVEELVEAEASIADLLAGGANVLDLFNMGVCVGTLRKAGALEADLIAAGLVGTLVDFEGNTYGWVKIGNQIWMDENLRSTKYSDGAEMNINQPWTWGYYYYDYNAANFPTYGYLYNAEVALRGSASSNANPSGVQGACPTGWHIPSRTEWEQLNSFLVNDAFGIDDTNVAKSMASTTLWSNSAVAGTPGNDQAANNDSGFDALPGGNRNAANQSCQELTQTAYFYGSTWNMSGFPTSYQDIYNARINYNNSQVSGSTLLYSGYSIRCVKD